MCTGGRTMTRASARDKQLPPWLGFSPPSVLPPLNASTKATSTHAVSHRSAPRYPEHEPGSVAGSPPPPDGAAGIELRTVPRDFRFPTQNQTRHCYVRYLEYHRCMKAKEGDTGCGVEQAEEGVFPGPI